MYCTYKINVLNCRLKGLKQRRVDVIVNDTYSDMCLLSDEEGSFLVREIEGAKIELELFNITEGGEEFVDSKSFTSGAWVGVELGSTLRPVFVSNDDTDALDVLDQLDEQEDDLDHGWPKLSPNVYVDDAFESGEECLLV